MNGARQFFAVWVAALCGVAACAAGAQKAPTSTAVPPAVGTGWVVVPGVKLVRSQSEADCGAAALRMVLARWSPEADRDVTQALGAVDSNSGYRAGMLRNVARARGFQSYVIEGQISDLVHEVQLGRPVIVGVVKTRLNQAFAHYQVVAGTDSTGRRLLIADPVGEWAQVDADKLLEEWRPAGKVAVVVLPSPQ